MGRLWLLALPAAAAILTWLTRSPVVKSSVAVTSALAVLVGLPGILGPRAPALAVVAALGVSAVGDWYLASRGGSVRRFVIGIAAFLLAHLGYLAFALTEGRLELRALAVLLALYVPYYLLFLRKAIPDPLLSVASLAYLVVSCVAFAAAWGLAIEGLPKAIFVSGIALVVFSDTVISLVEFLGRRELRMLILPTYFLALMAIALALLLWGAEG